jgi:glycosyltransferase
MGASDKSLKNLLNKASEDYKTMKMYDIGGITTLMKKNISKIPQFINVNK